ncbi:MAG: YbgA family protein [Candidatus Bipolaricaulaceae bacterium]
MTEFAKPRIVVSRCLGFAPCRYDGTIIPDPVIAALEPHAEFVPVCPEVEIGLPVPRPPLRLVRKGEEIRMVQPETGRDVTEKIQEFSRAFLGGLPEVDGFILKNRSPSCALRDAKVYASAEKGPAQGHAPGLFGRAVRESFPYLPAEDEGRLTNRGLREHFFTAVFALARLREVEKEGGMGELVAFHTRYKLVLMAQGQTKLGELGRIVANPEHRPWREVIARYAEVFRKNMLRPPRRTAVINALQHAFGHVSNYLTPRERRYFLELLEQYRVGRIPSRVPLEVLRAWVLRFGEGYLAEQALFQPFPDALLLPLDSGKEGE